MHKRRAGIIFVAKMSIPKRNRKRTLLKIFIVIAVLILILVLISSPLAKYLIQKYDVKYTGREITVDRVLLNPLAGSVSIKNFRLYEEASDSVFVYAEKFSTNLSILKLLTGTYEFTSLKLNRPEIRIVRNDSIFNFSDLMKKFAGGEKDTLKPPAHFNLKNIKIRNGLIRYYEHDLPVNINIADINFSSPGMFWNVDTLNGNFSMIPGNGNLEGSFTLNKSTMDYRLSLDLANFDMKLIKPYLDAMAGKISFSAGINLKIDAKGNFKELLNGQAKGRFEMDSLHMGRTEETDYFSMNRFVVKFSDIDLKNNKFYFDSILIDQPGVLYQKYDTLDNFRRMFSTFLAKKAKEKAKEAADTVSMLVNLLGSDYYVGSFNLSNANIEFNDYSIAEKFTFRMNDFNINADSIDKENKRVNIKLNGKISPAGRFDAGISMNPKDDKDFSLNYEFRDIPAPMFNPYIITFTSYPLDHGTVEMHGKWTVQDGNIRALNHFLVIDPRDTKKVKGKNTKWVPIPLIMSFVKERGAVIDYEIPVKGNLKDPKFKISDIISDLLRNILVKPPTVPYGIQVRNAEQKIEKTLTVKWQMRQNRIEDDQKKFLKGVAEFLKKNPEASIVVQPVIHAAKEKENILLFEAKKKYFIETGQWKKGKSETFSKDDSLKVEKLSTGDKKFKKYLNGKFNDPELLTLQEKCYRYTGKDIVEKKYRQLITSREQAFIAYFKENNTDSRIVMMKLKEEFPVNWLSYYQLNYKGDIPESLSKAFDKLYELNTEPPRRQYFQFLRR